MRNAGRLKLGYFSLPTEEGNRLHRLLQRTEPFSAIDPCVGTGAVLHLITANLSCRRYGVELDAERALVASRSGIETVQGNLFDAHAKVESFSLLYLNPPYDSEIGTLNNQRMELLFLEHTYRRLIHGGVLLFVVPEKRLSVCIPLLAANFTGFRLFRVNDPEAIRFEQVVLAAVRKPMRGDAMEANRALLHRLIFNTEPLDSGGKQRMSGISKQGNRLLQFLLVEAANIAVRFDPELRKEYLHRCHQKHFTVAKVATARKLASYADTVSTGSFIEGSLKCILVSASETDRLSRRPRTQ
jgi:Uncharacterised methyltransferase family (DUF6094)/Transposase IS116/IS110/IS902 family